MKLELFFKIKTVSWNYSGKQLLEESGLDVEHIRLSFIFGQRKLG